MSRQNRNQARDRKTEATKRDVTNSNERYPKSKRDESSDREQRVEQNEINGLDKYRMNDLYERSSI